MPRPAAAASPTPSRRSPSIPISPEIDITAKGELYEGRGDRLQIETAPGPDGYIGRMAVQASTPGTNPGWLVFALSNPTDERIVRWLVAPRYTLANSGVFRPELDAPRITAVTPSLGFRPEPLKSDRADMFRLNLEPGQTVTFAAELASTNVPRLTLWNPNSYQAKQQDRMLFNGVLLGITGLLAIFLTAIFAANHRAIFPATALVAWAALIYFCVDFGFWNKLFPVGPDRTALYRAAAEAGLAASLVLFLYTFLRIGLWHVWIRTMFWGWIAAQFALIVVAIIDPQTASGLARASALLIAGVGTGLIAYFALRGQDRAMSLIPSWMLLIVWLLGASMIVLGKLSGEIVVSGLVAGPRAHRRAAWFHRHPVRLPHRRRHRQPRAAEPRADEIARRRRLGHPRFPMARGPRPHHRGERDRDGARARPWRAQRVRRGVPPAHACVRP